MSLVSFAGPPEIAAQLTGLNTLGSFGAQAARFCTDPAGFEVTNSPSLFISLINRPRRARYRIAGSVYDTFDFAVGDIVLVTKGGEWCVDIETTAESLCVFLPQQVLDNTLVARPGVLESLSEAPFRAPLVESLVRRLCDEAASSDPIGPDYADVLVGTLTNALVHCAHPTERPSTPTISDSDMQRLTKYVETHLEEKVTTLDLECFLGMANAEFSKALYNVTGQTPYQFIISCRIAFARRMILSSDIPLSEIAYLSGFSSQAHMTDTFRMKARVTPSKLRNGS
ncbi:helix-turn-helix domain-containing protein [Ruegeria profundi]|uniref:HTH araC/xylS-type domain-containing protein n=1 Tax=Ruegeria profundi TaxID=1685378 RepID=A0A0X3U097_9RHOB|nr:AraC family transcriptional regulator [Ruegeria profundi]KUJ81378.1 hypothetical protein AVO44_05895 [Ruegeria profundi]